MSNWGERLKLERTRQSLTQAMLAAKANVDQQLISQIERGDVESSSKLVRIALALGVTPEWLQYGEEIPLEQGRALSRRRRALPCTHRPPYWTRKFPLSPGIKPGTP